MASQTASARANIQGPDTYLLDIGIETLDDATLDTYEGADEARVTRTVEGGQDVYLWEAGTQFQSFYSNKVSARASIRTVNPRTVTARARISGEGEGGGRIASTVDARARIQPRLVYIVRARAKLLGRTTREATARASIEITTVRTVTARARIARIQYDAQAKARIHVFGVATVETVTARARIQVVTDLFARAYIRAYATDSLEVSYNVRERVETPLAVVYTVNTGTKEYAFCQARAKIRVRGSAQLAVTYSVNYEMPVGCVIRPTQRIETRTLRTASARAKIVK